MSLKERITQIEEKRAEAALSVEDSDPRIRAGVEATVRNAKQALEELENGYKDSVMPHVSLIAVKGTGCKEFADIARIAFDTPVVDYEGVTNRIIDSVKSRSGRHEFSTQEFFMVLDDLNKLKLEYNILSLPQPRVNPAVDQVYNCEVSQAIKNLLAVNYDEQLNSVAARREIGKLALSLKFTGKNLPVIMYNYRGSLDEQYLPRPLVTLTVTAAEVNKDFVKEVLTQVKNRLSEKQPRAPRKTRSPEEAPVVEPAVEPTAEAAVEPVQQTEEQT